VRRLERDGVITGYGARLDAERLGLSLMLLVEVVLDRTTPDNFLRFREAVAAIPEVQECYLVAGNFDYLLKVRAADIRAYRAALGEKVAAIPGVAQTHTYVVMEHVKDTAELPVDG
jgi:Lrp/AsnC family leucine-responsive transcriptional regulator